MGDTQFRQALFGYNKADVDRFLAETTQERERLNDALGRVEVLMAELQDGPKAILEAAHREAAEIKAKAEREAARTPLPPVIAPAPVVTVAVTPVKPSISVLPEMPLPADRTPASFLQPFAAEDAGGASASPSSSSSSSSSPSSRQEPAWDIEFLHPNPPSSWRKMRVAALAVGCAALLGFFSVHFKDQLAIVPAMVQASAVTAPVAAPKPAPKAAPAQTAAPAVAAAAPNSMTLTISAEKACWIRMAIDNTAPVERVLQPSETLVLHALDRAALRVGDAGAIKLMINSRPARPLGANGEVVNKLITMENFASFLMQESS